MITYIHRSKLEPHPDNPRKDLGDLSELAASIQKSGLLQNLTVVPSPAFEGKYRIIIGHRRFAASEVAGLEELPCSIENMDAATQVATMLAENMQRNDLTVADQVGGVQTMMDLGEDVKSIADKTGLSATTIRKRNKLSILTTDKIKAAEQRGATLMDLMAVANIEDDALRESVLESAGTSNFANKLATAKEQEAAAKELEKARIQLETWAKLITRQEWNKDTRRAKWVRSITLGAKDADYSKPENAPEDAEYLCVYTAASKYVTVYIVTGEGTTDEDALRREREAKLEELRKVACEEVRNRTVQLRDSFMENEFRGTKEQTNAVLEFAKAAFHLGSNDYSTKDKLAAAEKMLSLRATSNPALDLAVTVYCSLEKGYSPLSYTTWNNKHQANEKLDTVYRFLMAVGYQMSDEEKAWQDGTHPCFSDPEIEEGSE